MKVHRTQKCAEPGCNEHGYWNYDTMAESREHAPKREKYRCDRHSNTEEWLSTTRLRTTATLVNQKKESGHCYFGGIHGRISGPGFKALSEDFPEGTKIIIEARVELP